VRQQTIFDDLELEAVPIGTLPKLLPIQQDLLTRGRAVYKNGVRRVIWQASCGAGKTWIAAEQTRLSLERGNRVLHIVHRRRLVDQMIKTLHRFGIYASPVMQGRQQWDSPVLCASRDTLLAMLKGGYDLPRANLIIPDECHVAAKEVNDWYLKNCPDAYWTGYTATPVRTNGSALNPPYQALVCMAPASELIKLGRLCPVKVYNPDAIGQRRRKGEKVKPVGDPVDHWKKYAKGVSTVVFAATVNDSQDITQRYNRAGIRAEHIDASTPEDFREEVFQRSQDGITKIISNVGVLVEGVDLPWLVCCQILRGCNSLVLWCQANGRVMRAIPGKTHGICLDHAGAAHEFGMPDSDFVWTLDDEAANTKANKPPKDRKPVTCSRCSCVFAGKPSCPECGKVLPIQRRKSAMDLLRPGDGLLTEFADGQNAHIRREAMERIWWECLHICRAKGGLMSQVAGMFTSKAKRAPWEAGLDVPMPFGKQGWATPVREWMEANRS